MAFQYPVAQVSTVLYVVTDTVLYGLCFRTSWRRASFICSLFFTSFVLVLLRLTILISFILYFNLYYLIFKHLIFLVLCTIRISPRAPKKKCDIKTRGKKFRGFWSRCQQIHNSTGIDQSSPRPEYNIYIFVMRNSHTQFDCQLYSLPNFSNPRLVGSVKNILLFQVV